MDNSSAQPREEEIAELAKRFWEEEGRPEGKADVHWYRAEAELLGQKPGEGPSSPSNATGGNFSGPNPG